MFSVHVVEERENEGVDWSHLAQHRDKWQVPVNTVTNFRVPIKNGELLEQLSDCEHLSIKFFNYLFDTLIYISSSTYFCYAFC